MAVFSSTLAPHPGHQQWHSNVQNHDVWLELIGRFEQRTAIFNATYYFVMGFEQFASPAEIIV